MLHKYRAEKLFKTWQPRLCTIEGLALVYKGKADGKVRGVVSLKDCVVRPAAVELGEGAFVIKSGTPFPTEIKDKKNRSFLQGRDYVRAFCPRRHAKRCLCHPLTVPYRFLNPIPKMPTLKACATNGSSKSFTLKLCALFPLFVTLDVFV
jgi:hypothetical protein